MNQHLRKLAEELVQTNNERLDHEGVWLRQVLALAAGALAILAGLGPTVTSDGPAQYFLAATWACLGTGIVSGASATYIATSNAELMRRYLIERLNDFSQNQTLPPKLMSVPQNRFLLFCKPVMVLSLLAAVLCLAAYAMITTLGL